MSEKLFVAVFQGPGEILTKLVRDDLEGEKFIIECAEKFGHKAKSLEALDIIHNNPCLDMEHGDFNYVIDPAELPRKRDGYFPITSIHRDDVAQQCSSKIDTSTLTDDEMEFIAQGVKEGLLADSYWVSIDAMVDLVLEKRKEDKEGKE